MCYYSACFFFYEEFRGGTDDLEGSAVDVEEVGGGADVSEAAVYVEGVEACGSGESLGGYGLYYVASFYVFAEGIDVGFVAVFANV